MENVGEIPAPCAIEINARKVYIYIKDQDGGFDSLPLPPYGGVAQR
jgi:hypothetical protein